MTQQTATTLVAYKVDQGSVSAAVASAERVKVAYADLKASADQVGLSVNELARRLNVDVIGNNQQVAQTNAQVTQTNTQVANSYRQIANEAERAGRAQQGNRLASGFSTVRGLGSGLGAVTQNPIGGQVAALVGITSEFGAFGIAALGVVSAVKLITDAENERAEAAVNAANDLNRIATEAARGATTESIKEQLAQEEARRRVLEETAEKLQEQADKLAILKEVYGEGSITTEEYTVLMGRLGEKVDALTGGAVTAAGGVLDLGKLLEQNQTNIEGVNREIALYNIQLETSAVKANDAAAEMERAWGELTDKLADKTNRLSMAIQNALDGVAAKTELVTTQTDNFLEALDTESKIRQEILDTLTRIAEIERERDERLLELAEDHRERRAEIEAEAAERIEEIARDSQDRIARILRDASRDQLDAVRRRDVDALIQSKERTADQLDDQRKADARAVEQVRKTQEKQLSAAEKGYLKQVEALIKSSNKQLEVQHRAYAQLQVDQQNAINAIRQIALNGSGGLVQIQHDYWLQAGAAAHQGMGSVVGAILNGFNQAVAGIGGGAGGIGPGGIGGIFSNRAFNNAVDTRVRVRFAAVFS